VATVLSEVGKTKVFYAKLLHNVGCQKLTKSANASQSYSKNKSGTFVIETWCILRHTKICLSCCYYLLCSVLYIFNFMIFYLKLIKILWVLFCQILHGFKNQVGDENWKRFSDQFPAPLRDRLVTNYGV